MGITLRNFRLTPSSRSTRLAVISLRSDKEFVRVEEEKEKTLTNGAAREVLIQATIVIRVKVSEKECGTWWVDIFESKSVDYDQDQLEECAKIDK